MLGLSFNPAPNNIRRFPSCGCLVRTQNLASVSEKDDSWRLKKIEILSSLALAVARCGEHKIAEDKLLVAIAEFHQLDGVSDIAGGGAHQVPWACLGNERVYCDQDRPPPVLCVVRKLSACVRFAVHLHRWALGGSKRELSLVYADLPSRSRRPATCIAFGYI